MGTLFQKFYDPLMAPLERRLFGPLRRKLLGNLQGEVLEIGAGTGINFPIYPPAAQITAIEPAPLMLVRARQRADAAQASIRLVLASGEALPFAGDRFDAVVATLVLCTVANPQQALAEIRRVLKPGGALYLLEHVRAEQPLAGRLMDWATPGWAKLCDGCHLDRRTQAAVESAGFEITHRESYAQGLLLALHAANRK